MRIVYLAHKNSVCMQHWAGELQKRGHDLLYLSISPLDYEIEVPSKSIDLAFRWIHFKFWLSRKEVEKQLSEFGCEIVHAHFSTNYGALAVNQSLCPSVVTVAGSDVLVEPKRHRMIHWANQVVFKKASFLNPVSPQLAGIMKKEYKFETELEIFPEGVNRKLFFDSGTKPGRPIKIISIRNFSPVYNHELFAACIPQILRENKDVRIVFLGTGPQLAEYKKRLQHHPQVEMSGWQPREKVAAELQSSHIYISTSLSDGASTSLLEAMATGVFPIVTDIPANRDWIEDGVNGFLVPTDDPKFLSEKIKIAIKNTELRREAALKNDQIIRERADDQKIITRLEKIYERILATN